MKRRAFLKSSAALSATGLVAASAFSAPASQAVQEKGQGGLQKPVAAQGRRRFELTQTYDLIAPKGSEGGIKLWIPVPLDTEFQQVRKLSFKGNSQDMYLTDDNACEAQTLFAAWSDSRERAQLTVKMVIETSDWEPMKNGELKRYKAPVRISYPPEVERYLKPTPHMPVDGIVRQTADRIVGRETDPLKKARLIYNWVSANMFRDNDVIGCGTGDVATILSTQQMGGKCTDINSVFVALLRSVGIPAREMFGIRLGRAIKMEPYSRTAFGSADAQGIANVSGAQHCRAMFYLAGYGWLPADPADVTKMRLAEKKEHGDPAVQAVNTYLFGNYEMNWVGFNYGRDFDLVPQPEQTPINNFAYPYAEVDGDPLNYYDPKVFSYDYRSVES